MKHPLYKLTTLSILLLLNACTAMPTGPSVMALPGTGKSFDQFRMDDYDCRQYALAQVGGTTANQAATNAAVGSAVVGTVIGAAAGAAMGGQRGSGQGAGAGLLVGSMAGAGAAERSAYGSQRAYDNAYVQCMYAKGEQVPISGNMMRVQPQAPYMPPPPPPGMPPY